MIQALIQGLLKVLVKSSLKRGFIKAELKTICENANITTGAVYKRYKGKEELFRAVVEKAVATLDSFVSGTNRCGFLLYER